MRILVLIVRVCEKGALEFVGFECGVVLGRLVRGRGDFVMWLKEGLGGS